MPPPGRRSMLHTGEVKPLGPHQCFMCSGSVQTWKTSSRGAAKVREITKSLSATSVVDALRVAVMVFL